MKCTKCKTELFDCDFVEDSNDMDNNNEKYRCPKCFKVKEVKV